MYPSLWFWNDATRHSQLIKIKFDFISFLPIRTGICTNTIADFNSGSTIGCLSLGHLDLARNVFELFGKMMPFAGNSKLGHDFSFPRVRFCASNCSLVEIIFVGDSWTSLAKTGTYIYMKKILAYFHNSIFAFFHDYRDRG